MTNCSNLKLTGLMSIGEVGDLKGFQTMHSLKQDLLPLVDTLELSIGTSADYEMAILEGGSTEIRVGTYIFGARKYP
jgi:uncharacterized pyridoxal phosphate-containing UPF0001 family protein